MAHCHYVQFVITINNMRWNVDLVGGKNNPSKNIYFVKFLTKCLVTFNS